MKRMTMGLGVVAVAALVALGGAGFGCSTLGSRQPSSVPAAGIEIPRDLRMGVRRFREFVNSERLNASSCVPILIQVYEELFRANPEFFDAAPLKAGADDVIRELFQTRLDLRRKLGRMQAQGVLDAACVDAARGILRAARFMEEYLAEWQGMSQDVPRAFEGGYPYLVVNPEFSKFELKSGDVLLSRGNAFVSAAIARIGDPDGGFSHLALIYIDERTGKTYALEAHIEIGSTVTPIEKYLTDGKVRAVVFRQADAKLAHEAARVMHERIAKASAAGQNVPYDFGMSLADDREIFCSEVPYLGYKVASSGALTLPLFETRLAMKNRKFLSDIGVNVMSTFAPSDMEVDPRFEIVAEWRNLGQAGNTRIKDAVLTGMYEWMEREGYILRNTPAERFKKHLAWNLRRWPLFENLLKDTFPTNMTKAALGAMFSLERVAAQLQAELEKVDDQKVARTGFAMTAREMAEALEAYRMRDLKAFEKFQAWERESAFRGNDEGPVSPQPPKSDFHDYFYIR